MLFTANFIRWAAHWLAQDRTESEVLLSYSKNLMFYADFIDSCQIAKPLSKVKNFLKK